MKLNFSSLLIAIGFAFSLFSCTDHRLGGDLSPARLRLKTVQSGTAVTTYTYDNQNRLSTISNSNGGLSVLAYGDPAHKYVTTDAEANSTFLVNFSTADQTSGLITPYPYTLDGTSFLAITYNLVNSKISYNQHVRDYQYTFDDTKHLASYQDYNESSGIDRNYYEYSYSSENITTEEVTLAAGHGGFETNTYVYDDKINPFFGLFDPNVAVIPRFSRNNILSSVSTRPGTGFAIVTTTYEYEYNQQNLPIKSTAKVTVNNVPTVTTVLTYTYESY